MKIFLRALSMVLALSSCQNNTPTAKSDSQTESAAAPLAKPEVVYYLVVVDRLNLREQPSKEGKVIFQCAETTRLEGTGQISAKKEEAVLRDMTYIEPYVEVTVTTDKTYQGWAYRGGLVMLYAGPKSDAPDEARVQQLAKYLNGLNTRDINSGKKAWDYVKSNYADAKGSLADAVYLLTERFLSRMEREGEYYKITEAVQWANQDYEDVANHKFDGNKYPQTKVFVPNGFRLETGEGMIFPVVDPVPLNDFFIPRATPAMQAFLKQRLLEQNDYADDDGGLRIGIEEVADRAVFWEDFNRNNPYFILSDQTKESETWMRSVLVSGTNNTPTFDYETGAPDANFQKGWAYLQQRYPNSKAAKTVKSLTDLLASEGGKRTAKVDTFVQRVIEE